LRFADHYDTEPFASVIQSLLQDINDVVNLFRLVGIANTANDEYSASHFQRLSIFRVRSRVLRELLIYLVHWVDQKVLNELLWSVGIIGI
jgi:hypothetical protein